MSNANDFLAGGYPVPILLLERPLYSGAVGAASSLTEVAIGTTSLTTIIDITSGKGVIDFLDFYHTNTTARTLTLIITMDGVETLNQVEVTPGGSGSQICAIGMIDQTLGYFSFQPMGYRSSLKVQVQTTNSSNCVARYNRYDT